MNRVPIHTPSAPRESEAARPRPSNRPPAATTGTRSPTASTTWGTSAIVATVPGVTAGLGALGDDEVAAALDRGDRVADLAAHAADQHVVVVEEVDGVAGHAEAGHEDPGTALDDVGDLGRHLAGDGREQVDPEGLGRRAPAPWPSPRPSPGRAHRRCAEAPEAAGLGDGGDQAVVRDAAHAGEHDGVLDLEEVGQSCAHGRILPGRKNGAATPPGGMAVWRPRRLHRRHPRGAGDDHDRRGPRFPLCVLAVNRPGQSGDTLSQASVAGV